MESISGYWFNLSSGSEGLPTWLRKVTYDRERSLLTDRTGEDLVVMSGPAFRAIYQENLSTLHTEAFVIWYNSGRRAGGTDGRRLSRLWGDMPTDRFMSFLADTYSSLGWGAVRVENIDLNSKKASLSTTNNPFVRGMEKGNDAICHFIRGFLEGFVEEILKSSAKCKEVACEAQGAQACKFELS